MNKMQNKKAKKREALLNSAYELFTTIGFSKTTILNISLNAGVGKGTFYLYFNDKDHIKNELTRVKSSELLTKAANHLDKTNKKLNFTDKIIFMIDFILEELSKDLSLLKFISKNLSWGILSESSTYTEYDDAIDFQSFVAEKLKEEKVAFKTPELTIYTIIELVNSTCFNIILNKKPVTIDEFKPYLYKLIHSIVDDNLVKIKP